MAETEWIMSEGGPLVCMEQRLQHSWGGVGKLSVEKDDATSDYDRACGAADYLASIRLQAWLALVIGPIGHGFLAIGNGAGLFGSYLALRARF